MLEKVKCTGYIHRSLLALTVTAMSILIIGSASCHVETVEDTEGNPMIQASTGVSYDTEHDGNYLGVGSGDDAETLIISEYSDIFECQVVMEYLDSALVCYQDSMGIYPESIEEAWNIWWSVNGSESDSLTVTRYRSNISIQGGTFESVYLILTSIPPECPSPSDPDSTGYIYEHTVDSYCIQCPAGHGSIRDGKRSWE